MRNLYPDDPVKSPEEIEFKERYSNKYYGIYWGMVADNQDPEKMYRLKCTFPVHFGDNSSTLDWALPIGSKKRLPKVGDTIKLQFVSGDITQPTWDLGPYNYAKKQKIPLHAQGQPDYCDQGLKGTNGIPTSTFATDYGQNQVEQTDAGHIFEMDDTPGAERVQLQHTIGTHIEMLADGSMCEGVQSSKFQAVMRDKNTQVVGSETHNVVGNFEEEIGGNYKQTINGDVEFIWLGGIKYNVNKHEMKTGGNQEYKAGGNLLFTASANHDTQVGGSRSTTVNSVDSEIVLGNKQIFASNATNVNPQALSLLLHGLNGVTRLTGTDSSGLASGGYVDISYNPPTTKVYSGPFPRPELMQPELGTSSGAGLLLDGTGVSSLLYSMLTLNLKAGVGLVCDSPLIQLGGRLAIHPAVLGDLMLAAFLAHVHPSAAGPTGTPDPGSVAMMQTAISTGVFLSH